MPRRLPVLVTESLLRNAVRCFRGKSAKKAVSSPCFSNIETLPAEGVDATITPERLTVTLFELRTMGSISVNGDFEQNIEATDLPIDVALATSALFLISALKLPLYSIDLLLSGSDGSPEKRVSTLLEPVAGRRPSFSSMFTSESCDDARDLL